MVILATDQLLTLLVLIVSLNDGEGAWSSRQGIEKIFSISLNEWVLLQIV